MRGNAAGGSNQAVAGRMIIGMGTGQSADSGFAAAQCGKASPYRRLLSKDGGEAKPRREFKRPETESRRLSAMCGGKAAMDR